MPKEGAGTIRVAVIDDDASVRRSLGRLLHATGMQPVGYASAEEFISAQESFDCLVIDIQLPGISGIELHRRLLEEGERTPVLFVTAHDEAGVREEALAGGCAGYFRKGDAGSDILEAIRRVARGPTASG